jgi:hypothetical protein
MTLFAVAAALSIAFAVAAWYQEYVTDRLFKA